MPDPAADSPKRHVNEAAARDPGRIAGVDYGSVRIGLALSDPRRILASPADTYTRRTAELDAAWFRRFAVEEKVSLFVVGLPVHLSGEESEKSREARRFGDWLAEVTGIRVEYFDERFTTSEAQRLMLLADMSRRRRKQRKDKVAAQIILSTYLEAHRRGSESVGPLDDAATAEGLPNDFEARNS